MYKLLFILLISFTFTQEPCEGTCLSEEESKNMVDNIQELNFDLDLTGDMTEDVGTKTFGDGSLRFSLNELFARYVIVSVVFEGAIPKFSFFINFVGSKEVSTTTFFNGSLSILTQSPRIYSKSLSIYFDALYLEGSFSSSLT